MVIIIIVVIIIIKYLSPVHGGFTFCKFIVILSLPQSKLDLQQNIRKGKRVQHYVCFSNSYILYLVR